jgi:isocitrate dehydrogenase
MLLRHVGDFATAAKVENALTATLGDGVDLTGDIAAPGEGVGTEKFVARVIANLGREGAGPAAREYRALEMKRWAPITWFKSATTRELVGIDVFIESERDPYAIGITMADAAEGSAFTLKMISSRGTQVWPSVGGQTFLVDHFRARFLFKEPPKGDGVAEISDLLTRVGRQHRWMHIEKLQRFDGADAFTMSGGEA